MDGNRRREVGVSFAHEDVNGVIDNNLSGSESISVPADSPCRKLALLKNFLRAVSMIFSCTLRSLLGAGFAIWM